jgi:hypothetical protein
LQNKNSSISNFVVLKINLQTFSIKALPKDKLENLRLLFGIKKLNIKGEIEITDALFLCIRWAFA